MEYALRGGILCNQYDLRTDVLILVLMEYALRVHRHKGNVG